MQPGDLLRPGRSRDGRGQEAEGPLNLLTDKGFGVEIVKKDGNGDLLYHVTIPGNAKDGYLLTVDGEHGKVKERKYISPTTTASFRYHAPATYAPSYSYSPASGSDDNCDFGSDDNAGY